MGDRTSVFLLRPADAPAAGSGVLDYQTDARALHYETHDGRLRAIDLVDATQALTVRDQWLSLTAAGVMADLHVSVDDADTLAFWATEPPSELRITGARVGGLRGITLNGRGLYLGPSGGRDTRLILGSDWREIVPRTGPVRVLLPTSEAAHVCEP